MLIRKTVLKYATVLALLFTFVMTSYADVSTGFGEFPPFTPVEDLNVPGVTFSGNGFYLINNGEPIFSDNFILSYESSDALTITFDEEQSFASFEYFQLMGALHVSVRRDGNSVAELDFRGVSIIELLLGEDCDTLFESEPLSALSPGGAGLSSFSLSRFDEPELPFGCDDIFLRGTATINEKFDELVITGPLPVELCECIISLFAIDDLQTTSWAVSDGPPDNRLNWGHGDGSIGILYPGDDAIDVYLIGTGQYIANFITLDDIPTTPPAQNTVIRQEGNVTVSILTTGEIQFNMGPDAEGKTYTFIIQDIYGVGGYGSYYDPNE